MKAEICFLAHEGLWNIVKKRILEDRRALLEEEGDLVRDHKGKLEEEEEMRRRTEVEETKSGRRRLREKLREGRGGTEPRVF